MTREQRLQALEGAVSGFIPDEELADYCHECRGPGGYRRLIDLARARMEAEGGMEAYRRRMAERGDDPLPRLEFPPCKGCGARQP